MNFLRKIKPGVGHQNGNLYYDFDIIVWHRSLHFTQATRRNKESHCAILADRERGIGHKICFD